MVHPIGAISPFTGAQARSPRAPSAPIVVSRCASGRRLRDGSGSPRSTHAGEYFGMLSWKERKMNTPAEHVA